MTAVQPFAFRLSMRPEVARRCAGPIRRKRLGADLSPNGLPPWGHSIVFTFEHTFGGHRIKIQAANPAVRTRKHEVMVMPRRQKSIPHLFEEKIAAEKARLEAQASSLSPSPQLDMVRRKIRQLETATHINEWVSSPELQPPKPP